MQVTSRDIHGQQFVRRMLTPPANPETQNPVCKFLKISHHVLHIWVPSFHVHHVTICLTIKQITSVRDCVVKAGMGKGWSLAEPVLFSCLWLFCMS
jgi:hypothetical protein